MEWEEAKPGQEVPVVAGPEVAVDDFSVGRDVGLERQDQDDKNEAFHGSRLLPVLNWTAWRQLVPQYNFILSLLGWQSCTAVLLLLLRSLVGSCSHKQHRKLPHRVTNEALPFKFPLSFNAVFSVFGLLVSSALCYYLSTAILASIDLQSVFHFHWGQSESLAELCHWQKRFN